MEHYASAVFESEEEATQAVRELVDASFSPREISALLLRNGREVEELSLKRRSPVPEGALVGATVGSALGGTLVMAGVVGSGGFALLAAGPALGILEGATAGAAVGGVAGALGGLGLWNHELELPVEELVEGAIWIGVAASDHRAQQAHEILQKAGGRLLTGA